MSHKDLYTHSTQYTVMQKTSYLSTARISVFLAKLASVNWLLLLTSVSTRVMSIISMIFLLLRSFLRIWWGCCNNPRHLLMFTAPGRMATQSLQSLQSHYTSVHMNACTNTANTWSNITYCVGLQACKDETGQRQLLSCGEATVKCIQHCSRNYLSPPNHARSVHENLHIC